MSLPTAIRPRSSYGTISFGAPLATFRSAATVFNRSYYEEVLIVRVHPEILRAEAVPDDGEDKKIWQDRYRSISGLERHLHENGTRIVKIFLHISKEEQRRRLLARIDTPEKNWKIKPSDCPSSGFSGHMSV